MIYEKILAERDRIQEELQSIDEQLATLPEGKLICTKVQQDSNVYYKWYHGDGHKKKYISKSNLDLAQKLAVKKYLTLLQDELNNEYQCIETYLQQHDKIIYCSNDLLSNHPEYSKLLAPFFKPLSQQLSDWVNSSYSQNPNHPENLIHRGAANHMLRSKSEAIIDYLLYSNKIPYRYECELQLGETIIYPDFTIKHPETGHIIYWEHFGMIDDPFYSKNALSKLQLYINNGIYPTINLIITFETKDNPLSFEYVSQQIKNFFS